MKWIKQYANLKHRTSKFYYNQRAKIPGFEKMKLLGKRK